MSDSSQQDAAADAGAPIGKDLILELSFVPKWAQRPPASLHPDSDGDQRPARESRQYGEPFERSGGGGRGRPSGSSRGDDRRRPSGPPRGDDRGRPSGSSRGDDRGRPSGPPRGDDRGRPSGPPRGDGRRQADAPDRSPYRVEAAPPPPPVDIRFYPEQKAISEMARQIIQLKRAFPLMDLAAIFTAKPEACTVRIEVAPGAGSFSLCQCKKCGLVAADKAGVLAHILKDHFADYFDKEEIVVDPPSGQFNCVAKCGLSGVLLGPPNHHSHAAKIQEMLATRFPNMTMETYSGQIQVLKDPLLIEQWKEESRKRTVYKLKTPAEAEAKGLSYVEAESWLNRNVAPELAQTARKVMMSSVMVRRMDASPLLFAIKDTWRRECRFPGSILFALRGALRGRKLLIFKVGHGKDFVTAIHPAPLDPNHVVQPIKDVLIYLHAHPGCRRKDLLEALCPGKTPDAPEAVEVLKPLTWLVEKGHIIEFFDGTFSVPLAERKAVHEVASKAVSSPEADVAASSEAPVEPGPEASVEPGPEL